MRVKVRFWFAPATRTWSVKLAVWASKPLSQSDLWQGFLLWVAVKQILRTSLKLAPYIMRKLSAASH